MNHGNGLGIFIFSKTVVELEVFEISLSSRVVVELLLDGMNYGNLLRTFICGSVSQRGSWCLLEHS